MPEWGFTDSISQFLGGTGWIDDGPAKAFLNFYAAVPSMHVCFAIMIGWPMARLVSRRPAKVAWCLYPLLVTFVVVATGNHYFTDVFLGALTAGRRRAGRSGCWRAPDPRPGRSGTVDRRSRWPSRRHARAGRARRAVRRRAARTARGPDHPGADARAADRVAADAERDLADRLRAQPRRRRRWSSTGCSSSPGSRSSSAR